NFMVASKFTRNSCDFIKFITNEQHAIRNKFKPVTISIHSSLNWVCFFLPSHRYPQVQKYIKKKLEKLNQKNNSDIELRFRPLVYKNTINKKDNRQQLQYFCKNEGKIIKLHNFVERNDLCDEEPYTRFNPDSKNYHMKWRIGENANPNTIINRIEGFDHSYNIKNSETDKYIKTIKNNAAIALKQMFKYSVRNINANKKKLNKAKSTLILNLLTTRSKFAPLPEIDFPEEDIENIIQKYPPFQIYAPNRCPTVASVIQFKKLKIGFLNINGGAFKKIRHDHPIFFQLISKHSLDIIAFIDTRIKKPPNWTVPGYEVIGFKKPQENNGNGTTNWGNYGGLIVYKKTSVINETICIHKTHGHDTLWFKTENKNFDPFSNNNKITIFSVSYTRCYKNDNKKRSREFFKALDMYTKKFKTECDDLISIGDFNSRLGHLAFDTATNGHKGYM
ncbi:MAG: hypothetical protein GY928_10430, partial [Colwellia sp.]|nr:hypothetical protein [Colwellia sp.]